MSRTERVGEFRTLGVDLAAQEAKTGLAVLRWSPGSVVLEHLQLHVGDDEIQQRWTAAALLGIDCPLGWPAPFTDLLLAHRQGAVDPLAGRDVEARRSLAFRRTDFHVHRETGRWPLSVSADLIGHPAMRAAGLLAGRLAIIQASSGSGPIRVEPTRSLRRSGVDSCVAEVYPAAGLSRWGLAARGYKSDPDVRRALVDELTARAGWFDIAAGANLCRSSDDALDAVVAGLIAGAVLLGRTTHPDAKEMTLADEEGWIHLPDRDFLSDPWKRPYRQSTPASPARVPPGPSSEVIS